MSDPLSFRAAGGMTDVTDVVDVVSAAGRDVEGVGLGRSKWEYSWE